MDALRRKKKPDSGFFVFVASRRAPERNSGASNSRPTSNSDSFAIRGIASSLFTSAPRRYNSETKMTFDEFVDWIQYSSATCVHSSPHRYQLDWFVDPNGNVLADFIGKFERLDEDWAFVAKKLGVSENLPHQRANPRTRHYTEYYTPRTRDIIANKFKVDIERFDYEFAG